MCAILKRTQGNYSNPDAVRNVVEYIMRGMGNIPAKNRIYGAFGTVCRDNPEKIIREIMDVKNTMGHNKGRQGSHIILSIGVNPHLEHSVAERMVAKIVGFWKKKYQVFYGVHDHMNDKGEPNWHIHIFISLTDLTTGNKGDILNETLLKFKRKAERVIKKTMERERMKRMQAMEDKSRESRTYCPNSVLIGKDPGTKDAPY